MSALYLVQAIDGFDRTPRSSRRPPAGRFVAAADFTGVERYGAVRPGLGVIELLRAARAE